MSLDHPLSDKEFSELDTFLLSDRCPEDSMTMDLLHGYLTAVLIGPEEIPVSEWLPMVWSIECIEEPAFRSDDEKNKMTQLIMRFANEIAMTLEVAPKEFEPLFCEHEWEGGMVVDGQPWAMGFCLGMSLREAEWQPIRTSHIAAVMRPVYLLGADEIDEHEELLVSTPVQRSQLSIEMEAAIPEIYRYWLTHSKVA